MLLSKEPGKELSLLLATEWTKQRWKQPNK